MTKRDLTYIKHIKPMIHEVECNMRNNKKNARMQRIREDLNMRKYTIDTKHKETCQLAVQMSPQERLMNYTATGDGVYLGVGCKWDLLTQLCRDKFGKVIGSI